ncbi:MAG TPA: metalloregulator ArsR/SmtB family transcription factor [Kiritimatiellia bacterium]|nr:metalloregulator ArsR/SmtB family transcription factor [Kiritimatiellia bacterium]
MKNTAQRSLLPIDLLSRMADTLKVLAHPHRLQVVDLLEQRGEVPVYHMMVSLELPQPVISQHLAQMRRVGLLACRRKGKEVWYRINDPRALTILDCIRKKQGATS